MGTDDLYPVNKQVSVQAAGAAGSEKSLLQVDLKKPLMLPWRMCSPAASVKLLVLSKTVMEEIQFLNPQTHHNQ